VGVVETVASLIRVTLITPAVTTRGPGNATRKYRRTSFRHVASCTYSSCVQLDPSPRRAEVLESPRTGGSAEPVKPGAAVQRERAPRSGTGAGRLLRPFSLALARAALRHRVPAHVYDARTMPGSGCGRSRSPGWLWSPRPWSVWALRSPSAPLSPPTATSCVATRDTPSSTSTTSCCPGGGHPRRPCRPARHHDGRAGGDGLRRSRWGRYVGPFPAVLAGAGLGLGPFMPVTIGSQAAVGAREAGLATQPERPAHLRLTQRGGGLCPLSRARLASNSKVPREVRRHHRKGWTRPHIACPRQCVAHKARADRRARLLDAHLGSC
jgi:hypothetical protein